MSRGANELLAAAYAADVPHATLVGAATPCAIVALVGVPPHEDRPRRAIEVAEAYARGEAWRDELTTHAHVVYAMAGRELVRDAYYAALAVGSLSRVPHHVAGYAAGVTRHRAAAVLGAWLHAGVEVAVQEAQRHMAALVRPHLPQRVLWELDAAGSVRYD